MEMAQLIVLIIFNFFKIKLTEIEIDQENVRLPLFVYNSKIIESKKTLI